jgi:hypothetical protein
MPRRILRAWRWSFERLTQWLGQRWHRRPADAKQRTGGTLVPPLCSVPLGTLALAAAVAAALSGCGGSLKDGADAGATTPLPDGTHGDVIGTGDPEHGAPRVIELPGGILVRPTLSAVELPAVTCLTAGFLEQVACSPGTREHESLLAVEARPSDVHAALLLAGLQPGAPGGWTQEGDDLRFIAPRGERVDVLVRYDKDGTPVVEPIRAWIHDPDSRTTFPDLPWVFGGSRIAANPRGMTAGEHYVADLSGSIIGLVTFGDEVIGFSQVIADDSDVQVPQWQVNSGRVPPLGTKVRVIVRRRDEAP